MRIVILGALGYIGTALIELYRGVSGNEIVAVDKRFVPMLIANLPDNVSYIQADILDIGTMKKITDGADIVYMMAAEVEAEKSKDKKDAVWKVNYEGAMDIAGLCGKETRFIFPSTGNVFGGVDESVKYMNLTEEDKPAPRLPYAESKVAVERFLLDSGGKNFTIVRFGTNYGYSPGVRFNLVTNIFVKKALQSEPIMLHGGGRNFRPTVHVMDAAGAAIFLATLSEASGQIYHVVCDSYRICELAETIAALVPGTEIHTTDDAVPFSSYHLSSEKLLKAGYTFQYNIESGVQQMIQKFGKIKQFHI